MARALLVTPVMPATAGNGLAMRAGLLLQGLARAMPTELLVVPVFGEPAEPDELAAGLARTVEVLALDRDADEVAEMVVRLSTSAGRARASALHPLPRLCRAATAMARATVAQRAAGVDLVVVLRCYLAPFLDAVLDDRSRPPIVIDVDDVESVTRRRFGELDEAEGFERVEAYYLSLADHIVTCSSADASALKGLQLRAVTAIPNAVRPPARTTPLVRTSPPTRATPPNGYFELLFCANLSYAPNVEGACWLCEQVLPSLGEVRAALVGSRPAPRVRALAADRRVTVAADVPDVGPWYEATAIAVVPLQRGGGSRIKLIEAFAHHRPVVSTPAGAEGLPWETADDPVVRAATPAQFAAACLALLSNTERARRLAQAGARLVNAHASVDIVAPMIARLACSVASQRQTKAAR
jgi:glycosyltransferase involved in cell wall biosynthesis